MHFCIVALILCLTFSLQPIVFRRLDSETKLQEKMLLAK